MVRQPPAFARKLSVIFVHRKMTEATIPCLTRLCVSANSFAIAKKTKEITSALPVIALSKKFKKRMKNQLFQRKQRL